jgi:vacuolar-type H+-ATPase subunit H
MFLKSVRVFKDEREELIEEAKEEAREEEVTFIY